MSVITQITLERQGPIATLTLSCPRGLNLLHSQTLNTLLAHLHSLREDTQLASLIITGGTAKSFSAGADIAELLSLTDIPAYVELGQQVMEQISHFPVPVIAALNGYALGAGFSLALACELRLLSNTTRIGQLAVRNGLIPPFGNIQQLLQTIGPQRARELIYTGKLVSAPQALAYGLVNEICPPDQLQTRALELAQEIAVAPTAVIRLAKKVITRTLEEGFASGYLAQEDALLQCLSDQSSREILEGFLNKPKQN